VGELHLGVGKNGEVALIYLKEFTYWQVAEFLQLREIK
jgi:hypothetical protein